jgi:hypothetical protein
MNITRLRWMLILAALSAGSHAAAPRLDHSPDRVLVKWKDGAPPRDLGLRVVRSQPRLGLSSVAVPAGRTPNDVIAQLGADPRVAWAEPVYTRRALALPAPNEPTWNVLDPTPDVNTREGEPLPPEYRLPYMWCLEMINAPAAWDIWPNTYYTAATKPANAIKVAVIDTGCDITHEDFRNGGSTGEATLGGQLDLVNARNFVVRDTEGNPTPLTRDPVGHGTFCSGVVAASANNGGPTSPLGGAIGLAYGAQVLPLEVLDNSQTGLVDDLIDAIVWAVDHGARVISLSLGEYTYSQAEQEAVDYAWSRGVLVVAAAGNDGVDNGGQNRTTWPGACNHVLAVGAVAPWDTVATYSNTGNYVGITAPGGDVFFDIGFDDDGFPIIIITQYGAWSAFPNAAFELEDQGIQRGYDYAPGTSAACPFVAALGAMYLQKNNLPQTTASVVKAWQAIQRGAENVGGTSGGGWSEVYGFGRIDAAATLLDADTRSATTGAVTGKVTSNGVPVAGATIRATKGTTTRTATTRTDGGFRLPNLSAGTWLVKAETTIEGVTGAMLVTTVPGADVPGVDFALKWRYGDTDGNRSVNLADAVAAISLMNATGWRDPSAVARADVSPWTGLNGLPHGDGTLTMDDVRGILRIAGGLASNQ